MRLVFFKTPKPTKFNYQPMHFDAKKDEWERRKAELGYGSSLTPEERTRLKMDSRWRRGNMEKGQTTTSKLINYLVYAVFILGSIYVVLFTNLVENFLSLFGLVSK